MLGWCLDPMVLEVLSSLSGAVILWSSEYLFNVVEYLMFILPSFFLWQAQILQVLGFCISCFRVGCCESLVIQSAAVHWYEGEDRLAYEARGGPCHHQVMSPSIVLLCSICRPCPIAWLSCTPPLLLSCRQVLPSTCAHNLTNSDVLMSIVFCAYPERNNAQGSVSFVEFNVSLNPVLLQTSGKDFPLNNSL